jgi:TolB protein
MKSFFFKSGIIIILTGLIGSFQCQKKSPTVPEDDQINKGMGVPIKIIEKGGSPAWSPDGKRIVYVGYTSNTQNIFTCNESGGDVFQVTNIENGVGPIWTPSWSPDGQQIAFTTQLKDTPGIAKVFSVASSGGKISQITPDSIATQGCHYSPVESSIIFDGDLFKGLGINILKFNLKSGKITQITKGEFYDGWPEYSPDGGWIAFESNRNSTQDRPLSVWITDKNGDGLQMVTTQDGQHPNWSPNGKWIVFSTHRNGNFDIWIISLESKNEIQITNSTANENRPSWSPDGTKIAYDSVVSPGVPSIYIVSTNSLKL